MAASQSQLLRTLFLSPLSSLKTPFLHLITRPISSISSPTKPTNTRVNYTPPGSDSEPEPDSKPESDPTLFSRPPNGPFGTTPTKEQAPDPKNLQEVFHRMRTDGLIGYAAQVFDEMSRDGLTHEALELFREIKDKGTIPDVVAHTAVIEAYANAGKWKEAHRVYLRMLGCGVAPNAYTYGVVIRALAEGGEVREVRKCVLEMLGKEEEGMRPNARVCCAVFEAFAREGKAAEARELLEEMKEKGFKVDEKGVREFMKGKRGHVARIVMDILIAK